MVQTKQSNSNNKGVLGFEKKLWQAADKLRGNMDSAELNTLFWV